MIADPTNLYYLLSMRCNERCSKCDHWQVGRDGAMPTVEAVVAFARALPALKELCLVGGEPLLHGERVLALIDGLADTAVRTIIVTNGTACTPRFLDRLRGRNVHLVFSIDTLDPEFWKFVRGCPSFERVMANFEHARQVLAPAQISVQSVLAAETVDHVAAVGQWCRALGVHHSVQDYVQQGFNGRWTPLVRPDEAPSERCLAAGRNLSIMPDGAVFTCFQQPLIPDCEAPLGQIGEAPSAMLRSAYAQAVVEHMRACDRPCKVLKCNS